MWADFEIGESIGSNVSTADGTDPCDTTSICSASSHGGQGEPAEEAEGTCEKDSIEQAATVKAAVEKAAAKKAAADVPPDDTPEAAAA